MKKVTIVIPVYRGLEETQECIYSLYNSLPDWVSIIVINDCSPEVKLSDWLRLEEKKGYFKLYENEENLGFVKTVNKGINLSYPNDVLLLNSDVEVPDSNWLERIRNSAYSVKNIASITPFSNNATICSFPDFCQDNKLAFKCNVNEIDEVFSSLKNIKSLIEIPTGVGFCMYITRVAIDKVGLFDAKTFGKGYGEENDWCQRAIKLGLKNYHLTNVFVYHKGGVSFAEECNPRKQYAQQLLSKIHPNYQLDVANFIKKDPGFLIRRTALLNLLRNVNRIKVLTLSHGMGGGVKQHVNELVEFFTEEALFFHLEPDGNKIIFSSSELEEEYIFNLDDHNELNLLSSLLVYIKIDSVHIHHILNVPYKLLSLIYRLGCRIDLTVHDFFLINGNPTLTDANGQYLGELNEAEFNNSIIYKQCNELITKCERIIFPSNDTFCRFTKYIKIPESKVIVSYHPDMIDSPEYQCKDILKSSRKSKVLVLGALSKAKGADILERVATTDELEYHLLGYSYRTLKNVITHGAYDERDVVNLIDEINPDIIWFPALWPETYSYTLSIALRTNKTIVAPKIGAFPERLSKRGNKIIYDIDLSDKAIAKILASKPSMTSETYCEVDSSFYKFNYLSFPKIKDSLIDIDVSIFSDLNLNRNNYNYKEKLIIYLWRIKNNSFFSCFFKLIPFSLQRYIKRKLTKKALHDLK